MTNNYIYTNKTKNMARIKVIALCPKISYVLTMDKLMKDFNPFQEFDEVDWEWREKYINTEPIKDIEQYTKTQVLITYYGSNNLPVLVRGTVDDIQQLIVEKEYEEHILYKAEISYEEDTSEEEKDASLRNKKNN